MAEQWMSVAEAAATLKVHPRTIERRIASGKIESRRSEDGQVQILVDAPEAVTQGVPQTDPMGTVERLADRQVDIAAGSASALIRVAQNQAERSENELVFARQEAKAARKGATFAFSLMGAMAVGVMVAIGWCTHTLTETKMDVRQLSGRVEEQQKAMLQLTGDRDTARLDAEHSNIAAAKAEGELVAYKTELATVVASHSKATTKPTNLAARLASAFMD